MPEHSRRTAIYPIHAELNPVVRVGILPSSPVLPWSGSYTGVFVITAEVPA